VSQSFNPNLNLKNQTMQYLSGPTHIYPFYRGLNQILMVDVGAVQHNVTVQSGFIASKIQGLNTS
jgi:hypothetical protein